MKLTVPQGVLSAACLTVSLVALAAAPVRDFIHAHADEPVLRVSLGLYGVTFLGLSILMWKSARETLDADERLGDTRRALWSTVLDWTFVIGASLFFVQQYIASKSSRLKSG